MNLRIIFKGLLFGRSKRDEMFPFAQNCPKFLRDFSPVAPASLATFLYVLHVNLHAQGTPQCLARCISGEVETLAILGFQDFSGDCGSPGPTKQRNTSSPSRSAETRHSRIKCENVIVTAQKH